MGRQVPVPERGTARPREARAPSCGTLLGAVLSAWHFRVVPGEVIAYAGGVRPTMLAFVCVAILAGSTVENARAVDIQAQANGYAFFPGDTRLTEIITSGSPLPNGGRAFSLPGFTYGAAACPTYVGQNDWFCASAGARVEITRRTVQTQTYTGSATSIRLKAHTQLSYRKARPSQLVTLRAQALVEVPVACFGTVTAPVGAVRLWYRLDGVTGSSSSDSDVVLKLTRPFETCAPSGLCYLEEPSFSCGDTPSITFLRIDLNPLIRIENDKARSGWNVDAVLDYGHTLEIQGIEVVDTKGDPIPGARVGVPDGTGGVSDYLLTQAEYEEDPPPGEEATTTTTTLAETTTTSSVAGTTSTTTPAASTTTLVSVTTTSSTTTLPVPCAGLTGVESASCRCGGRPLATCQGATPKRSIAAGVDRLCVLVDKAGAAAGRKQGRLRRKAAGAGKRVLVKVNGAAGRSLDAGCRDALRTFCATVRGELLGGS